MGRITRLTLAPIALILAFSMAVPGAYAGGGGPGNQVGIGVLFAGLTNGRVFRSVDDGNTWQAANAGLPHADVNAMAIAGGVVYAGTDDGVYRSSDGGRTWQSASGGALGSDLIVGVAINPRDPRLVYAAGISGRVFRSADGGHTWTSATVPGEVGTGYTTLTIDPSHPSTLLLVLLDQHTPQKDMLVTTDSGASWQTVQGLPVSDQSFFVESVAYDPVQASIAYAATDGGLYISHNAGKTWRQVGDAVLTPDTIVRTIAVDPSNHLHLIAGDRDGHYYTSVDGGASWRQTASVDNGLQTMLVDPVRPSTVLASAAASLSSDNGTMYISRDGGTTWKHLSTPYTARVLCLAGGLL